MKDNMTQEEKYLDAIKKVDDLKTAYDKLTSEQQRALAQYAIGIELNKNNGNV